MSNTLVRPLRSVLLVFTGRIESPPCPYILVALLHTGSMSQTASPRCSSPLLSVQKAVNGSGFVYSRDWEGASYHDIQSRFVLNSRLVLDSRGAYMYLVEMEGMSMTLGSTL